MNSNYSVDPTDLGWSSPTYVKKVVLGSRFVGIFWIKYVNFSRISLIVDIVFFQVLVLSADAARIQVSTDGDTLQDDDGGSLFYPFTSKNSSIKLMMEERSES